ncbi:alpha-(1,3)-fucosyltransferase 7 [Astyanax mexicanus]|uniref:Fucosyltransferase n=1 Tax=Astyanax mexicanus TaxID=7994 RepID=A0A8B9GZU5_ASTMX|nr:alpha-(1,3)-fucosyltransferase 7 [Astyanax mexicanus]
MWSLRVSVSALMFLVIASLILHLLVLRQFKTRPEHLRPENLTILLWHWPFGVAYSLKGNFCWEKFGIPGCFLEDNRSMFSQAEVVVFHHHELWTGRSKLPLDLRRPLKQRWLWLSLEPPMKNGNLSTFNSFFNWTMSYRRDADIFMPYGKLVPKKNRSKSFVVPKKTKCLVAWVVSNYKEQYRRSKVFQQLKDFIPEDQIEVYGQWKKRPISNKALLKTISQCFFYLAFENSECKDYISEKLWRNALQAGSVPVVLGPSRANYEAMVRSDAFIHVDDFRSVRELAAFLKYVASHNQTYGSYFRWHESHEVKIYTDWRERLCTICSQYHKLPVRRVYKDLYSWVNQ